MSATDASRWDDTVDDAVDDAVDAVHDAATSDGMKALARLGFAARATIYLLIGIFALLLAFGARTPEADQRGAMQEVTKHQGGFLLLIVITIGLAAYALWRWSEAAFGVIGEGPDGRDAGPRLKSFFRGCVYAFFAVNAINLLLHSKVASQAQQQQLLTARVMSNPVGRWIVAIAGLVVIVVGIALIIEGVRRTFRRYFDFARMSRTSQAVVWALGAIGTTARGIVFTLTGIFIGQAALDYDPAKARGLDGALRELAGAEYGGLWVGIVAFGLIAFGLYGYAEAIWRRT